MSSAPSQNPVPNPPGRVFSRQLLIAVFVGVLLVLALRFGVLDFGLALWKVEKEHPDPIAAALDKVVTNLAPGKIAFAVRETMKLDEHQVVTARISNNLHQDITAGMAQSNDLPLVVVEDIRVAPLMSATLNGTAFEIKPLSKEEQAIANDSFTEWDWDVHPLDWGRQTLYLNVCATILLKGAQEHKCVPVYQRGVVIHVAPWYAATHFVANNAAWTFGAIGGCLTTLAAGIGWLLKHLGRPKDDIAV